MINRLIHSKIFKMQASSRYSSVLVLILVAICSPMLIKCDERSTKQLQPEQDDQMMTDEIFNQILKNSGLSEDQTAKETGGTNNRVDINDDDDEEQTDHLHNEAKYNNLTTNNLTTNNQTKTTNNQLKNEPKFNQSNRNHSFQTINQNLSQPNQKLAALIMEDHTQPIRPSFSAMNQSQQLTNMKTNSSYENMTYLLNQTRSEINKYTTSPLKPLSLKPEAERISLGINRNEQNYQGEEEDESGGKTISYDQPVNSFSNELLDKQQVDEKRQLGNLIAIQQQQQQHQSNNIGDSLREAQIESPNYLSMEQVVNYGLNVSSGKPISIMSNNLEQLPPIVGHSGRGSLNGSGQTIARSLNQSMTSNNSTQVYSRAPYAANYDSGQAPSKPSISSAGLNQSSGSNQLYSAILNTVSQYLTNTKLASDNGGKSVSHQPNRNSHSNSFDDRADIFLDERMSNKIDTTGNGLDQTDNQTAAKLQQQQQQPQSILKDGLDVRMGLNHDLESSLNKLNNNKVDHQHQSQLTTTNNQLNKYVAQLTDLSPTPLHGSSATSNQHQHQQQQKHHLMDQLNNDVLSMNYHDNQVFNNLLSPISSASSHGNSMNYELDESTNLSPSDSQQNSLTYSSTATNGKSKQYNPGSTTSSTNNKVKHQDLSSSIADSNKNGNIASDNGSKQSTMTQQAASSLASSPKINQKTPVAPIIWQNRYSTSGFNALNRTLNNSPSLGHYAASLINVTAPMILPLSASESMEAEATKLLTSGSSIQNNNNEFDSMAAQPSLLTNSNALFEAAAAPSANLLDTTTTSNSQFKPKNYYSNDHWHYTHQSAGGSTASPSFQAAPLESARSDQIVTNLSPTSDTQHQHSSGSTSTSAAPALLASLSAAGGAGVPSTGGLDLSGQLSGKSHRPPHHYPSNQAASGFRSPSPHQSSGGNYASMHHQHQHHSMGNIYANNTNQNSWLSPGGAGGLNHLAMIPPSYLNAASNSLTSLPPPLSSTGIPQSTSTSSSVTRITSILNQQPSGPASNFALGDVSSGTGSGNNPSNGFVTSIDYGTGSAGGGGSLDNPYQIMDNTIQQQQQQQTIGGSHTNVTNALNRRSFNLTRVEHISAECSNDLIRTVIIFNGTFKGIIYSSGYVGEPSCMYVNGTGKTRYDFSIRLNQCGTHNLPAVMRSPINKEDLRRREQVMFNTLSIQYNPIIEQEWDEHFRVSCEYGTDFWKTISFNPFKVETNTGSPVTFTAIPPACQMEVRRGHNMVGPRQEAISGPVTVGDPLTLLIHMKSEKPGYDILVKNCIAHNGGHQKMALIDSNGCVVNERFISPFRGTYNDQDLKQVTLYAYLKAFRFTGSPVLYLECEIHMCQSACPPQMCYWRRLSKRSAGSLGYNETMMQNDEDDGTLQPNAFEERVDGEFSIWKTRIDDHRSNDEQPEIEENSKRGQSRQGRNLKPPSTSGQKAKSKPSSNQSNNEISDTVNLSQSLEVRQDHDTEPALASSTFMKSGASEIMGIPTTDHHQQHQQEDGSNLLCYRRAEILAYLLTIVSIFLVALSITIGCCWRATDIQRKQRKNQATRSSAATTIFNSTKRLASGHFWNSAKQPSIDNNRQVTVFGNSTPPIDRLTHSHQQINHNHQPSAIKTNNLQQQHSNNSNSDNKIQMQQPCSSSYQQLNKLSAFAATGPGPSIASSPSLSTTGNQQPSPLYHHNHRHLHSSSIETNKLAHNIRPEDDDKIVNWKNYIY